MRPFLYILIILAGGLLAAPLQVIAQETDTTSMTIEQEEESDGEIQLDQQYERSVSGGSLTDMGTYNVPSSSQYYQAPFEAQEELDRFMEEYREEMKESNYWNFLKAVSPYIRLHLGVRDFNTLDIVGRDNPLWQSYSNDEELD
ncbi:MAG: hypothetical protein ACQEST_10000 [Bacteroidota bacterium]